MAGKCSKVERGRTVLEGVVVHGGLVLDQGLETSETKLNDAIPAVWSLIASVPWIWGKSMKIGGAPPLSLTE